MALEIVELENLTRTQVLKITVKILINDSIRCIFTVNKNIPINKHPSPKM